MTYRDVLVTTGTTTADLERCRLTARLARLHGSRLTGVFLASDFFRLYGAADSLSMLSPDSVEQLLKDLRASITEAGEKARAGFEAAAAEFGVEAEWQAVNGDDAQGLVDLARRSDLTVCAPETSASYGQNQVTAAQVGLGSGGPVLVMPRDAKVAEVGRRILVAWNGSREASRALRDAWPLVEAAEAVHVVSVRPSGAMAAEPRLQRYFERHGRQADVILDPAEDAAAGEALLRHVATLGADLVVMGLYGRPRLQELVLGGASRTVLAKSPVPVFVSH